MKPLLAILLLTVAHVAYGADCKVVDPELQGTYEGGCRNGLAHGVGAAKGGVAEYQGEFRKGLKHGNGVKTWAWGDRYEGSFRDDRRHGKGSYAWGARSPWAGERYEGDYVADMREGWGLYYWPNGDRFEGQWKADLRYGYSAMEIRRQASGKARAEALVTGARVCSKGKIGIAYPVLRVGTVEEVGENSLKVRLLRTEGEDALIAANGPEPGTVLAGPASDWDPCL